VGVAAGAMIDRVTEATGRLGPVGDSSTMAANILQVWNSDRDTIREAARANALQFGWDSSMEALFGRVYPAAFERRRERQLGLTGAAVAAV
jgi:alpha-1,6-mannosyltransferase